MQSKFTVGIIKEGKVPADNRTPLIPKQCLELMEKYPYLTIKAEPSNVRCFKDEEFIKFGVDVTSDLSDCDILLGIKEVPIDQLIANKTYCFFSHTIKKQAYNRKLLQTILEKNINLIDYEVLTDDNKVRLIGFGKWAGVVGAHYGLLMVGERTGKFKLKRAIDCLNLQELVDQYDDINFPNMKIVITGGGRVANGAIEIMEKAGILEVNKYDFLEMEFDEPVYVQLHSEDLYQLEGYTTFDNKHFYEHPAEYKSSFAPYLSETDVLINCMYWSQEAPRLFTKTDIGEKYFRIRTISDISCDIEGSCPITIEESYISNPVYGIDRYNHIRTLPYQKSSIDVMAVSNLPNELPRDASKDFGKILSDIVLPKWMNNPNDALFERATITSLGKLTNRFNYLQKYVDGL